MFVLSGERRKKWHGGSSRSLPEDGHGGGEEDLGVAEFGNIAAAMRGEIIQDPVVGGDQGDTDHQRNGEPDPFSETRV